MTYDEIPLEAHGTAVDVTDAHLFRERWGRYGQPVRVAVTGTHTNGGSSQTSGFVVSDRQELFRLINRLQGAYYGWPADHR